MNAVFIESHYLPTLEYFCAIASFEGVVLEANEYFQKQTLRNRTFVNTAQGRRMISVPLANAHGKIPIKKIRLEEGNKWRNIHWRTIESAYRKAPYFDYFAEELRGILFNSHEYLFDLNKDLLSFCLKNLRQQKIISETLTYEKIGTAREEDYRFIISDRKPFDQRDFYRAIKYYQVFGNEFVPNLSVIDLLFCEGPESARVMQACLNK